VHCSIYAKERRSRLVMSSRPVPAEARADAEQARDGREIEVRFASAGIGFEQYRVHVAVRRDTAGPGLHLSAMFCGLKGATRTPRRASTRHNPVTSRLLPASEVVP
jgi:hypothetical protein